VILFLEVDLIAGVVGSTVAIYAAVGLFFLAVRLRHPADEEYGVFAVLCAALAFLSAARVTEAHAVAASLATGGTGAAGAAGANNDLLSASRFTCVALVAATVLLVHFALDYARPSSRRAWLAFAYSTGAAYELLNARGMLHDVGAIGAGAPLMRAPMSVLGVSMYAAAVAGAAGALTLFAKSYLRGRREALALVIGVTIVVATLMNDFGYALGFPSTGQLGAIGFLGVAVAGPSTFLSRYLTTSGELGKKAGELRTRTRELRKALADLGAAEEELGRKEQLAVVGELAAVIAHEVRNPLAIIANAVSGLRKPTLTKGDQDTLLSILDEETTRLNRLVSDLLRYARPVNVQRQSISLRDLLERGLQLAKTHATMRVELSVETAETRVWGDANLLRQVFENLIDNAAQAMSYGGTLTVKVRQMRHESRDGVAVDIIDTGEGMDTIVRSRARDPFFTTRPSGTGLGLAIVDRIVDAHGGHFLIESRAGEGTTATVFLPTNPPSEPAAPRPRTAQAGRRTSSVPPPPGEEKAPKASSSEPGPAAEPSEPGHSSGSSGTS
jgi:signal transduction histidine kinase